MTGEITLRGRVLPIGGIKEKVLAAHRAGIKTFILPKRNMKDLEDVPREVLSALHFVPVERMDDVINVALHSLPPSANEEERLGMAARIPQSKPGEQAQQRKPISRIQARNAISTSNLSGSQQG